MVYSRAKHLIKVTSERLTFTLLFVFMCHYWYRQSDIEGTCELESYVHCNVYYACMSCSFCVR